MRKPRNLSGVYFRYQNPETKEWENRCFEDLPTSEQTRQMDGRPEEWLRSMCLVLAETIRNIGDQCDIIAGDKEVPPDA